MKLTRLGLGSFAFTWAAGVPDHSPADALTPAGLLAHARRLGVHLVQFNDNLSLARLSPSALDAFEAACRTAPMAVEVGTRGLEIRDLHQHLALARRFRSPIVRVVVDRPGDEPSPREVVERLRLVAREFLDGGVRIAIENHDRFTVRTLERIVQELGTDFVGICLDTVNSFGALEDPERVVETLGPYTLCVHVKDFTIRRPPHQMGFLIEGCAAGRGRLNLHWLLDALEASARQPFSAILETWVTPGPQLAETLQRELAWTEEGIAHLRQWIPT